MRSFFRQIGWEFRKLFAQRRTPVGFAVLLAFELVVLAMLQHDAVRAELRRTFARAGYTFQENFTGPTIAAFVMEHTMAVLGNLFVALTAGEIVAKEIEDGTMRMLLCRPVHRRRVVLVKLATCLLFTAMVTTFISFTALGLGLGWKGTGYWLFLSPKEEFVAHQEFWPGMARYFQAIALLTVSASAVTTLAFMFSCMKVKPAAAAILALSVFVVDDTLRNIPYFGSVREHFLMTRIVSWLQVYRQDVPWAWMWRNYATLVALYAAFIGVGWFTFRQRDIK